MTDTLLAQAGPFFVGLVLFVTAWLKAVDPAPFLEHVDRLQLVRHHWAGWLALAFLGFEAALGTALMLGWLPGALLPGTAVLLVALAMLSLWGTSSGRVADCGCYNGAVRISPPQSLALNALYVALLGLGWVAREPDTVPPVWEMGLVLASGAIPVRVAWHCVRTLRPVYEFTPLKAGRRWKSWWLTGHPPGVTGGEYVVVWMSSTCPQCKKWIPVLNAVARHRDLPSVVGALSMEPEEVLPFMEEHRITFPIVVADPRRLARLARAVPTAVHLRHGRVVERWVAGMPEEFVGRVKEVLGIPDSPGAIPVNPGSETRDDAPAIDAQPSP